MAEKEQQEHSTNLFKVLDQNGQEVEYELLFTMDLDETGKTYMVYTDNIEDENGNIKTYASIYQEENGTIKLVPISTDKEWKTIETYLEKFNSENKDEQ